MQEKKKSEGVNGKELSLKEKIALFFCGFGCLGGGYGLCQIDEWLHKEYVAVGYGLDPRGLIGLAAIGLFVLGAVCIFLGIVSLLPVRK